MNRGDVVLVQVPYVGSPGAKLRPALIVQSDRITRMLNEVIIVAISSNVANAHQKHHFLIDIRTPDGAATGLRTDSVVRCERIHTVPKSDVQHVIGKMSTAFMTDVERCLKAALGVP